MTIEISVRYREEYFNRVARATIPEHWEAKVVYPHNDDYFPITGLGNAKDEAIKNAINDASAFYRKPINYKLV